MREFLRDLLSRKYNEPIYQEGGIFHFIDIALLIGTIVGFYFIFRNKSSETKNKFFDVLGNLIITLLISDLIIVCFTDGSIGAGRIPFNLCNFCSIAIVASRFGKSFNKFKNTVALYSLLGGFFFFTYPGTAIGINLFCYTSIQTRLYHGIMAIYGFLYLLLKEGNLCFEKDHKYEVIFILFMLLWASLGNFLFPGSDFFFLENRTFGPYVSFLRPWMIYIGFPIVFVSLCYLFHAIFEFKGISKKASKLV